MLLGVQASPVMRDEPEPLTIAIRSFSFATVMTDKATPELIRSLIMRTFWVSNHSRALAAATSGLLRWSLTSTSIGRLSTLPPAS